MRDSHQPPFRIGQGFDVHAFAEGRRLILGGVEVPHERGLAGHSDADVLTHAICDALLGALALGDIGTHFPDTDVAYKDVDSQKLLGRAVELIRERGWEIANIDGTIIAQAPKMSTHIPAMRERLATTLGLPVDRISVKATTTEHLGFAGRGEGIAALASALLVYTAR